MATLKRSERVDVQELVRRKKKRWCRPGLQRLFDCCRQAFHGPGTVPSPDHVKKLCQILDGMNAEDFGLTRNVRFFKPTSTETPTEGFPRVTSATIYRCKNFELSIFFLPANGVIPLHNHPEMTVFNKLLLGTMHVKSYDWADDNHPLPLPSPLPSGSLRLAKVKADTTLRTPCAAGVLYPTSGGNIHEFTAVTPCAMLDVLAPPYSKDDQRDCSFFREHLPSANPILSSSGKVEYGWLEEIDEIPEELEMDAIAYMGPQIIPQ